MPLTLFKLSGFLVYLCVVFINTFVDLGHKIIIQNTIFKSYDGADQIILTAIVNGLILLPFILLFTPSGYISDKYQKNKIMQYSAWVAVGITLMITLCYYQGWFWLGFSMTFLLAMQSAFYSPAKYGFIKEIVGKKSLAKGNGAVQATTMVGILVGIFFFSILFELLLPKSEIQTPHDTLQAIAPLGWVLVILSMVELLLAYRIPSIKPTDTTMRFDWKRYTRLQTTRDNISYVFNNKVIWLSLVGLSIFWSISQVILAAYPTYAEIHLGLTNTALIQGLMACAGIGIIIGSYISSNVSSNHIEMGLIPIGALGISISVLMINVWDSILFQALNFLLLGVSGGLFIIPLNTLLQYNAGDQYLGRVLATNNLIQNISMLSFLILTALFALLHIDSITLLYLMALVAFIGTTYTLIKLPQSLIRFSISRAFLIFYSIKVIGFKHIPPDRGVLLLGNHISWIDWALIQIAAPRSVHFVMERKIYQRWYLKHFLRLFGVIPISKGNYSNALKQINSLLRQGKAVCLFPEGTISRSGQLSTFKQGYEQAIKDSGALIIPFYLHGLWGSSFSRSTPHSIKQTSSLTKRDIIIAFGKPLSADTPTEILKQHIFSLSHSAWIDYAKQMNSIPHSWVNTAKQQPHQIIIGDTQGTQLTHLRLMTAVFRFAKRIQYHSPKEHNIGLIIPPSIGATIANFAVLSLGKTIVNLNFTSSPNTIQSGIIKADIKTVYTSKKLVTKLKRRGIDLEVILANSRIIYLEDLKQEISQMSMLFTMLLLKLLPTPLVRLIYLTRTTPQQVAAILFSSGSEGLPKGIELTHSNLSSNVKQMASVLNPNANDIMMANLPTFHAFGLVVNTLLPVSEGLMSITHPDPTDALNIAKAIAKYKITFLIGTSTFLKLYINHRRIHPLMLDSIRLVISGAEKLNPHIRDAFQLKFSKEIYEGYGSTENSPAVAGNIPDTLDTRYWSAQINSKRGTVGLPIPGTALSIVDPNTYNPLAIGEEGLLLVAGPQVMKGYLKDPEKTNTVILEREGHRWYKTGDKAKLDHDGFLTIVDRYSRFAKISAEMVSLTAVEETIRHILKQPEMEIIAVAVPSDKKGEQIIVLIAGEDKQLNLRKQLINGNINPLMLPSSFHWVDKLPLLGTGKTDFSAAKKIVEAL